MAPPGQTPTTRISRSISRQTPTTFVAFNIDARTKRDPALTYTYGGPDLPRYEEPERRPSVINRTAMSSDKEPESDESMVIDARQMQSIHTLFAITKLVAYMVSHLVGNRNGQATPIFPGLLRPSPISALLRPLDTRSTSSTPVSPRTPSNKRPRTSNEDGEREAPFQSAKKLQKDSEVSKYHRRLYEILSKILIIVRARPIRNPQSAQKVSPEANRAGTCRDR